MLFVNIEHCSGLKLFDIIQTNGKLFFVIETLIVNQIYFICANQFLSINFQVTEFQIFHFSVKCIFIIASNAFKLFIRFVFVWYLWILQINLIWYKLHFQMILISFQMNGVMHSKWNVHAIAVHIEIAIKWVLHMLQIRQCNLMGFAYIKCMINKRFCVQVTVFIDCSIISIKYWLWCRRSSTLQCMPKKYIPNSDSLDIKLHVIQNAFACFIFNFVLLVCGWIFSAYQFINRRNKRRIIKRHVKKNLLWHKTMSHMQRIKMNHRHTNWFKR